ncbi:transmembrane protein 14A [Spea bombifrons]|uniref:transmembrane protein 14A n=1 Tax=Spea bombifrons TaxID=233779 RepID=UPI00234ADB67|nr:transmembrane protein 14A [Spea bombifrons]
MAVDWIGFGYAALLAFGGYLGYARKGSIVSLITGLTFGIIAGYGAYCVSLNARDVKISLFAAIILATVMSARFYRSRKIMPAGVIAAISIFIIMRLGLGLF